MPKIFATEGDEMDEDDHSHNSPKRYPDSHGWQSTKPNPTRFWPETSQVVNEDLLPNGVEEHARDYNNYEIGAVTEDYAGAVEVFLDEEPIDIACQAIDLACHEDFDSDLEDSAIILEKKKAPLSFRVADCISQHAPDCKCLQGHKPIPPPTFNSVAHKRPRLPSPDYNECGDPDLMEYFQQWPALSPASRIAIARTYANYLAACLRAESKGKQRN